MNKEQLRKLQFEVLPSIIRVKAAYNVLCKQTVNFALQEILNECEEDVNSLEETYNDNLLTSVEKERLITLAVNRIVDMVMEYVRYESDVEDPSIRTVSVSYILDYIMGLRYSMARCGYGHAFYEEDQCEVYED